MAGLNRTDLKIAKTIKLFIAGEFPRTESGRSFPAYKSGTQELYAHLCLASRKDFRNAVTAAQEAQKSWESKTAYNRSQILYRMAEMAEAKRAEFMEVLFSTLGYSEAEAGAAVDGMIDAFVYYAGWADKYQQVMGAVNPVAGPHHNFTSTEPVGVVGLLADEKFDLARLAADLAAILVSGNTVVALLAKDGAAVLGALAETLATSDLPKGVVNLLSGDLAELKAQFGSHMELDSLSYQGSDKAVLAEVQKLGVENMKRIVKRAREPLSLEHLLSFIEYKTVWHPIGY